MSAAVVERESAVLRPTPLAKMILAQYPLTPSELCNLVVVDVYAAAKRGQEAHELRLARLDAEAAA